MESPPLGVNPDDYEYQGVGNLNGIINKLDYLQNDLGVDAVWVSPHYFSPERDMVCHSSQVGEKPSHSLKRTRNVLVRAMILRTTSV
jgi:glycosidase